MAVLRRVVSKSGFTILPVHYSHDPEKDATWVAKERAKYTDDAVWRREMELDFSALAGLPAYGAYNARLHLVDGLEPIPTLPLCLAMDFNIAPMIWEVCQIVQGRVRVLYEIVMSPARIDKMVEEFRNLFPTWRNEVRIYGDSSGTHRSPQTAQTDYDLVRLALAGYPAEIVMRVTLANPLEKDRLNAVNRLLVGQDGNPGILVNPRCKELVADFEQVVLKDDGRRLHKVYSLVDPYSRRTHASDAIGYLVAREFPVWGEQERRAVSGQSTYRSAPPLKYKRLVGDLR